jgi:hypothetical protein
MWFIKDVSFDNKQLNIHIDFKKGTKFTDSSTDTKANKFKYYVGEFPVDYLLKEDNVVITMTDLSKDIYQIWLLRIMKKLWINVAMLGMTS